MHGNLQIQRSSNTFDISLEALPQTPDNVDTVKLRPNLFGRSDLADTYRKAKGLIIEHNIFRLCQLVEANGITQLTICNLWRIEKQPDKSIKTFEFQLIEKQWQEVTALKKWPTIPFFPISETRTLVWWRDIIQQAIWKALNASGYDSLPHGSHEEMSKNAMARQLIRTYLGEMRPTKTVGMLEHQDGYLSSCSMEAGARALRSAFWQHFVDKEIIAAAMVINYRSISFLEYLDYAMHRDGFLSAASQNRNLLPILPHINPSYWHRKDWFSRKLWVKDGRTYTKIDRRAFYNPAKITYHDKVVTIFRSFDQPAPWRWLQKASSVIVSRWVFEADRDSYAATTTLTNLALVDINVRAPVIAYTHILKNAYLLSRKGVSTHTQKLISLFLMHCAAAWEKEGFSAIKAWLKNEGGSANFGLMLDYLEAEGYAQGQPSKNATWASLARRSDDWHRRIALINLERALDSKRLLEWEALVPETVIDDITFRPLLNTKELAVEGYEVDHCAGDYDWSCHRGGYRVYSCLEPDGIRSTLGISIDKNKANWSQHLGRHNIQVSPAAKAAGEKLAKLYQQALTATKKRPPKKRKPE